MELKLNRRSLLLGFAAAPFLSKAAMADCTGPCPIANWQATRKPYDGPLSGELALACVRLLCTTTYHSESEVLLVSGKSAENGDVLTSLGRGNGHSFTLANQPRGTEDVYIREFCFDPGLIANLSAITFCNGAQRGDGNHHTLAADDSAQAPYLRNLKRTGHVGDFLTLLGTERTYRAPISTFFTASLYSRLYGRHGEWLGA